MQISDFRILTFDTYGTLIDWESGIYTAFQPLTSKLEPQLSKNQVLEAFGRVEQRIEHADPTMLYRDLLTATYSALAKEWAIAISDDEASTFGRSVKNWPAFDDAPASLNYLRQHFQMATLTNCDRISYMGSNARLEIEWDAIYTAQDIGSYKPNPRNFDYLFHHLRKTFGIVPKQILHVAQSLTHDMVPATKAGMTKVWINRRHDKQGFGATAPPKEPYEIEFTFNSMAAFADAHRAEHS